MSPENDKWYDPTMFFGSNKPDTMKCKECGCSWFQQIAVAEYPRNHTAALGQRVNSVSQAPFYLFKCIKCGELHEPSVQAGRRDTLAKNYDRFVSEIEEPLDPKAEDV